MNTKVHLIGFDQQTAIRYARVVKQQGINNIEISESIELGEVGLMPESGVVILGYNGADKACQQMLNRLQSSYPQITVILVTESSDLRTVVDALRFGALDHVVRGEWDEDHLEAAIQRTIRIKDLLNADRGELWKQISSKIHAA